MTEPYILDACALIAVLKNENGAEYIDNIYKRADEGEFLLLMNKINLYEVYYGFYRENGKAYAENIINSVRQSVVIICDFSDEIFYEAGRLKSKYKISLADSIVLAQTIVSNGILITADHHELDIVERNANITFKWFR